MNNSSHRFPFWNQCMAIKPWRELLNPAAAAPVVRQRPPAVPVVRQQRLPKPVYICCPVYIDVVKQHKDAVELKAGCVHAKVSDEFTHRQHKRLCEWMINNHLKDVGFTTVNGKLEYVYAWNVPTAVIRERKPVATSPPEAQCASSSTEQSANASVLRNVVCVIFLSFTLCRVCEHDKATAGRLHRSQRPCQGKL